MSNQLPCPFCGKLLNRAHFMFDTKIRPDLLPSMWLYTCGDCQFMGSLTGDRERDLKARNLLAEEEGDNAES